MLDSLRARGYRPGKEPTFRIFVVQGNTISWREPEEKSK